MHEWRMGTIYLSLRTVLRHDESLRCSHVFGRFVLRPRPCPGPPYHMSIGLEHSHASLPRLTFRSRASRYRTDQ